MAPSDSYENSDIFSGSRAGSPTGGRHFLNRSNESLRISKLNQTDFIVGLEISAGKLLLFSFWLFNIPVYYKLIHELMLIGDL